jgi:type IV pilus assembly protein PilX
MSMKKQRGVVLIVALLMLLVVTLLGVAVMSGATLDLKMANNSQERHQAFNVAEAALAQAEAKLMNLGLSKTDLSDGCSGSKCFNASCTNNGLCFFGQRADPNSQTCSVVPASGTLANDPWSDTTLNVWGTASKHQTITANANVVNSNNTPLTADYIIEFRCYIDGDLGTVASGQGDALFRITARGHSAAGNTDVMLQSTFRMKAP